MEQTQKTALGRYRVANNMTLDDLGVILGTHKSTLSRWENGEVPIPADRVVEIEQRTGVSRAELRPDLYDGYLPPIAKEAVA